MRPISYWIKHEGSNIFWVNVWKNTNYWEAEILKSTDKGFIENGNRTFVFNAERISFPEASNEDDVIEGVIEHLKNLFPDFTNLIAEKV